jgi:serine/threonine protein phosphatase PrpC
MYRCTREELHYIKESEHLHLESQSGHLGTAVKTRNYPSTVHLNPSSDRPSEVDRVLKLPELVRLRRHRHQSEAQFNGRLVANLSTNLLPEFSTISPLRSSSLGRGVKMNPPKKLEEGKVKVQRCAYRTKKGSIRRVPKTHNQDAYLILPLTEKGGGSCYIFGVFDGHGQFGHHVSRLVKDAVAAYYSQHSAGLMNQTSTKACLREGLSQACQQLRLSGIDLAFSGTTACIVHICQNRVTTANIGDSRAIIGGLTAKAFDLTSDHKPNIPVERNRILRIGGRIAQAKDERGLFVGPLRVWLKNEDYPGLAMSRSIGDQVAHDTGVTDDPGEV